MAKKKKKETGGNAVIYARYSSHNQREASLEQQIAECKQYAERNGYKIIDLTSQQNLMVVTMVVAILILGQIMTFGNQVAADVHI